ncbi:hypothetical protein CFB89_15435 [Burkholderia sp. AU16741]|nr:hypothetical protein CFB89_15435 [Burkholderia sp. AU16741]
MVVNVRDRPHTRCRRNVSGHSSGQPRPAFQSVVESKSRILLNDAGARARRRAGVKIAAQPIHGSSMFATLRSPSILAAVAAGARAAGLKLKKRLLD